MLREQPVHANDNSEESDQDIEAIARICAVPILLNVLCDSIGASFAAIVRTNRNGGSVCAVEHRMLSGLKAGDPFSWGLILRAGRHHSNETSGGSKSSAPPMPTENHIYEPIVLTDGRHVGDLCAVHRRPSSELQPWMKQMFRSFSKLIGLELEKELNRGRENAALIDERAAVELREQFVAILGHDLRNPLHAISTIGVLLQQHLTDPRMIDMAARIRTSTRRMSTLIDDTLDFARVRLGGGLSVEIKEVANIEVALSAAVRELQDGHPARRITSDISVRYPVRCDVGRLQQLVSNLLSNALSHGYADSTVRFTAKSDSHYLVLEVWNDGDPLSPTIIAQLFHPFWRYNVERTREGLGLGLHICNQIARAHHGNLTVTSERHGGTTFTARLPSSELSRRAAVDRDQSAPAFDSGAPRPINFSESTSIGATEIPRNSVRN